MQTHTHGTTSLTPAQVQVPIDGAGESDDGEGLQVASNAIDCSDVDHDIETSEVNDLGEKCGLSTWRNRVITQCQTIIAQATGSESVQGLTTCVAILKSASSTLTALERACPTRLGATKKILCNKKLEKQFRFFSTRAKRIKQRLHLTKPSASNIRDVKRKLLENGNCSMGEEPPATERSKLLTIHLLCSTFILCVMSNLKMKWCEMR